MMIKLTDIFTEHGYPFRENDRSIITRCPQCGKEDHLYIFIETSFGKCMKCGELYNPESIIMAVVGCSFEAARSMIRNGMPIMAGDPIKGLVGIDQKPPPPPTPLAEFPLPYNFFKIISQQSQPGREYLADRGVHLNIMDKYDLRYSPTMERVIFPVHMNGKCVGWQGRDIAGKSDLRYMSPSGFSKGKVLLGYDLVTSEQDYVILTEGPVDALKVAILHNSICSMGKEISKEQIALIKSMNGIHKVYLALDPDAFENFSKIAQALEPHQQVFIMQPPPGRKDFGECSVEEILRSFLNAKKYGTVSLVPTSILKS